MRKRRKRVFARMVLLSIAVTLGLIVSYVNACQCHAQPDENCVQLCGWWCCFLSDPGAVITAYGIFIAVLGFWFISVQIEQGHKGLKQTKRSVTAMVKANAISQNIMNHTISVDRGRLSLVAIHVDDDPENVPAHNSQATLVFKNTGRYSADLAGISIRYHEYGSVIRPIQAWRGSTTTPVAISVDPGQIGRVSVLIPPLVLVMDAEQNLLQFWATCWLNYTTIEQQRIYRFAWEYSPGDDVAYKIQFDGFDGDDESTGVS